MDEVAQYKEYADECRGLAATAKKTRTQKAAIRNGYGVGYRRQTKKSASLQNGIWANPRLRRAKPGELPIEAPTQFELVINLKSAKRH